MNSNAPFSFVPIDNRRSTEKPRKNGLSMVIDDGLPTDYVRDVLRTSSAYIDLMKIKTGTARLYPREVLINKLAIYKAANIRPFLGGQFHEYVFAKLGESALQQFYEEALALGFETIEISDNTVLLTPKQRHDQIANATRAGLDVFGEVGSKETMSNPMLLVEQAQVCFDAGARLVLVEAAELVENGRTREDTLHIIKTKLPSDKIMIELPGPWIQGVRSCDIEDMKKIVFKEFGPNVNLANIDVKTIYDTEVQRIGLGTSGPLDS
ncbi:MAG: phosphosulfolactate synthase [Burkholderiaceae bacterium]